MKKIFMLLTIMIAPLSFASTIFDIKFTASNDKSGIIIFTDTPYGLLVTPNLQGLPAGLHGLHLHEFANCGDKGQSAGGHYDPKQTHTHLGPYAEGHAGDLPALYVDTEGKANLPTLAPRLTESELKGHAIIIHEGGDNYADNPTKLGGGGARLACGLIKK